MESVSLMPVRCLSCGKLLNQIDYEKYIEEGLSAEEAMDKMKLRRMCCRTSAMSPMVIPLGKYIEKIEEEEHHENDNLKKYAQQLKIPTIKSRQAIDVKTPLEAIKKNKVKIEDTEINEEELFEDINISNLILKEELDEENLFKDEELFEDEEELFKEEEENITEEEIEYGSVKTPSTDEIFDITNYNVRIYRAI
jgi:DNA-directed RNA polymerase subunit N (RpoN/RPB10)